MKNRKKKEFQHIFGPVPSRRLGMSLGVDIMPHKTCSLDCVYCECGKTTNLTLKRDEYISIDKIKEELKLFLHNKPELDFITFSGSGEPTLHVAIDKVVDFIKSEFPQYKVALLTNSTLFHVPQIRESVKNIDVVIASLDAVSEDIFFKINRPHEDLELSEIIEGIITFRKEFANQLWIEIFIVPHLNDSDIELEKVKNVLSLIKPDRVQLNSLDRPGTESWVKPVNPNVFSDISKYLLNAEIIDINRSDKHGDGISGFLNEQLLSTIKRRPCTSEDISRIFGISLNEAYNTLGKLVNEGEAEKVIMQRGVFYTKRGVTP